MKRLFYLTASLFLLGACSSQTKVPSSQAQPTSIQSVYEQLVMDYEQAAHTSMEEVDNPLLNSQTLELASRYTGDGKLDLVSKQVDLDKDGQVELLIGTKTPTGNEEVTIYTGAYGQVNGQVVDLLADLLDAESDPFFVFYKNNRMRLDFVTEEAATGNAIYELTNQGFKELIRIETDLSGELDDSGNYLSKDGEGNSYQADQVEAKIAEVLGHAWDQEVID